MPDMVMAEQDVAALLGLLTMRPEPPTREGIRWVLEHAPEETTVLGRPIRHVWLKAEPLDWLRGALDDHLRTAHVSPSDRATFSRILTRLWADDLLPPATAPRPRFFARAQIYSIDANASHRAQEFLEFKIAAATHAREQILMVLNRGVTTYQAVRDATTGAPSGLTRETQSFVELFHLRLWLDLLLFELVGVEEALLQAANIAFNVGVSPRDPDLRDKIQAELVGQSERTLRFRRPRRARAPGLSRGGGPPSPAPPRGSGISASSATKPRTATWSGCESTGHGAAEASPRRSSPPSFGASSTWTSARGERSRSISSRRSPSMRSCAS